MGGSSGLFRCCGICDCITRYVEICEECFKPYLMVLLKFKLPKKATYEILRMTYRLVYPKITCKVCDNEVFECSYSFNPDNLRINGLICKDCIREPIINSLLLYTKLPEDVILNISTYFDVVVDDVDIRTLK